MIAPQCHYCNAPINADAQACPQCGQPLVLHKHYRLARVLGQGGFGVVYEAQDLRLGRRTAIKAVPTTSLADQQRIEAEAGFLGRYAAQFPFIPDVYDLWSETGRTYLAMEYIDGPTLDQLLAQPWSPAEVAHFLRTILGYLADLHDASVIHRDLKPQNIKRTPQGRYVLLDFGIAKQGSATMTVARALSPEYSPIEQIQGLPTDARSDLYSLGATAYHLLVGKPPLSVVSRITTSGVIELPSQLCSSVPPDMERTLLQMLALNAVERPSDARAALALLDLAAPVPPSSLQVPPHQEIGFSSSGTVTQLVTPKAQVQPQEDLGGSDVNWAPNGTGIEWAASQCVATPSTSPYTSLSVGSSSADELGIEGVPSQLVAAPSDLQYISSETTIALADASFSDPPSVKWDASQMTASMQDSKSNGKWRGLVLVGLFVLLLVFFSMTEQQRRNMEAATTANAEAAATATVVSADATATALLQSAEVVYSPSNGELKHYIEDDGISVAWADINVTDAIFEAQFYNPYSSDVGIWDYGFFFRSGGTQYRVYVDGHGTWTCQSYETIDGSPIFTTIAYGTLKNFNSSAKGSNYLRLLVHGNTALFFVNGSYVTTLDTSKHITGGDIGIGTGFQNGGEVNGATTHYKDFTIWSLDTTPTPTATPAATTHGIIDNVTCV